MSYETDRFWQFFPLIRRADDDEKCDLCGSGEHYHVLPVADYTLSDYFYLRMT